MARRLTGYGLVTEGTIAAKTAAVATLPIAPDADGIANAEIEILIGDLQGRVIGELDATLAGVAWKLNDYGQARLTLPQNNATATSELLNPGNRILIRFGNGLPDWGGLIDPPLKWSGGNIEVTAYSGERLFADRITDEGAYYNNYQAGNIFMRLISEAVPVGVDIGNVWIGGEVHTTEYHLRQLYDIFTKSLTGRIESADWDVTPSLRGGQIVFSANYYERKGIDHVYALALIDGVNLAEPDYNEQGPIINEWHLAGAGTGWSPNTRIFATARDEISIGKYGLRQRGEVRTDVVEQETLDRSAEVAVAQSKEPRPIVSGVALDLPPARWRQYGVGDSLWMELYDAGFGGYEGSVRVIAREFLPQRGVCSLVIE